MSELHKIIKEAMHLGAKWPFDPSIDQSGQVDEIVSKLLGSVKKKQTTLYSLTIQTGNMKPTKCVRIEELDKLKEIGGK